MQEVYRALDATFNREVALKVPKNTSAVKRFRKSAIISAQVNHANVAKTLDFFEADGREHLIEEFVNGQDLSRLMKLYVRFDPFLSAHIFHHIVKGVAASHDVGVFHRDLKPENILVSSGAWPGFAKITDFGIAKMAAENIDILVKAGIPQSLGSSTLVGALPYMAPELISAPKEANKEADVWALGAMLYEFLAGIKPFGESLAAVAAILSAASPAKPKCLGSSGQFDVVFDSLWEIAAACLVKDPGSRPTAAEIAKRCADLCYSAYPREEGRIRRYLIDQKAIGFIDAANTFEDVFFHKSSYYGDSPSVGQRVVFSFFLGGDAPRAHPVIPLKH